MNQNVGFRIEHRIKTWGEALMRCRVRRDFSHKDVAERVNVSKAQVKAWENNEGQPDALQLKKLYASISWLRGFEGLLEEQHGLTPAPSPSAPASPPPLPLTREDQQVVAEVDLGEGAVAPPRNFGEALRRQRLKEGLDQDELSELMRVSQASISRWELDRDYPVRDHYDRLCDLMPELRSAPLPYSRSIPKPVGPTGWPRVEAPPALEVPRLQVENLQAMDRIVAAAGDGRVDGEALDYGRALLEAALARAALAAAQDRLRLAEVGVASREIKLREAAELAARKTNERPEGGQT